MKLIDTHTHLFAEQFNKDRDEVVQRALEAGVEKLLLPNIDASTIAAMKELAARYPQHCLPMMGLHPGSVGEDWEQQLEQVEAELRSGKYIAVGETGLDFYWDTTYEAQQKEALRHQVKLAKELDLPIVLHTRESFEATYEIISEAQDGNLRGVFHCFTYGPQEAQRVIDLGFYLGIGGVLIFKNSDLANHLTSVDPSHLVLETDSPYLAPVPHRGQRNESAYVASVAERLAAVYELPVEKLAAITTANAEKLFALQP